MSAWLNKIVVDPNAVLDVIDYFEKEYLYFQKELDVKGHQIIAVGAKIPGLSELLYARWSELKCILDYMETMIEEEEQKIRVIVLNTKNRSYTVKQVEDFVGSDQGVLVLRRLKIYLKYTYDKIEGVSRGIERLHHQVRIIADLRKAGLDDSTI